MRNTISEVMDKVGGTASRLALAALLTCAALVAFAPTPARAQTYGTTTLGNLNLIGTAGTNIVPAATSTNQSAVIDCRGNRHLNFTVSIGALSNATTATASFLRSPDNIIYDDTAAWTIVVSAAANSVGTTNVDFDVGAVGFVKFSKFVTGATYGTTNPIVKVSLKPGS